MDAYGIVSSCPSLRFLKRLKEPPVGKSHRVCGIAFSPTEEPIPNVLREVESLALRDGDVRTFIQEAATPRRVLDEGRRSCLLHVACHGHWSASDPLSSYLRLSADRQGDGELRLSRLLAEGDFTRSLELVVLSACHSGQGAQLVRTVQEHTGLSVGFLARGARAAVSSLWEVGDLVSMLLMGDYHARLRGGAPIDSALMTAMRGLRKGNLLQRAEEFNDRGLLDRTIPLWRESARRMRDEAAHPYVWAPFTCSGWTWRPVTGLAKTPPERLL
jgi:CHAT domain-containing protein